MSSIIISQAISVAGVIVSGVFAYLLWSTTKKLGLNNLEFQEKLKNDNKDLMLYKYRMDCFLNAEKAVFNMEKIIIINLTEDKVKDASLKLIIESRELMLRSRRESCALFDKDITSIFEFYLLFFKRLEDALINFYTHTSNKQMSLIEQKLKNHIGPNLTDFQVMQKANKLDPNEIKLILHDTPHVLELYILHKEFYDYGKSNNIIEKVMPYFDVIKSN